MLPKLELNLFLSHYFVGKKMLSAPLQASISSRKQKIKIKIHTFKRGTRLLSLPTLIAEEKSYQFTLGKTWACGKGTQGAILR